MDSESAPTLDQLVSIRPVVNPEPPLWSPDGKQIAFLSGLAGEPELWSISPNGGFPARLTIGMGGARFLGTQNARWSPDGKWIAYICEKSGTAEIWVWSVEGGTSRQLTRLGANISGMSWAPDSQSLVFANSRYGHFDIYTVRAPGGQTRRLTTGTAYDVYPVFTADGQGIVFVRMNDAWTDHEIIRTPAQGGDEQVLHRDTDFFDYHYGQTFGYPLPSPDGKTILFRSYRSGFINYWQVSMHGGEAHRLSGESADQSEATWSPDGRQVALISNHNGTLSLRTVSIDKDLPRTLIAPEMGACSAPQWSPDGKQIAYLYQSPSAPLDLWVASAETGEARQLTHSMLGGHIQERLALPEKVVYKTFDGLAIHAYLYKPTAIPADSRLPAIIWAHGGPSSQWFDAFYANVQYFVQQGYVVLMPNVRGSTGYGHSFEDLNMKDWGHGDLQDVVAGVECLKHLEYVDPNKMAITGTSYGGFMAAAAVCFAPGIFQAAIAASGYADRVAMYHEQELRHIKQLEYKLGPFETSQDVYRKCSATYAVKQATTPVFVLHGEGRLPRSSASLDFAKALEKEYKTVQYKTYPNEGYYVQSLANTRQMWLDMRDFLERYLGGIE